MSDLAELPANFIEPPVDRDEHAKGGDGGGNVSADHPAQHRQSDLDAVKPMRKHLPSLDLSQSAHEFPGVDTEFPIIDKRRCIEGNPVENRLTIGGGEMA